MSLETVLAAIEASGDSEVAQLRAEAQGHVNRLMAEAERAAAARREAARRSAREPAAAERARLLHRARLEAMRARGECRARLVEGALSEARCRLTVLRGEPAYPLVLGRLMDEAIHVLGDERAEGGALRLEVDPRDEALVRRLQSDRDACLPISPSLDCWGGVVARSADGRIVATNTLEARLERAAPFLRRDLAAFFERCLSLTTATPDFAR